MGLTVLSAVLLGLASTNARAQGSLTPPGVPAPTMKTLDQVEPRVPLSTGLLITNAGSYYLTTNLTVSSGDVIRIDADNVTLDLNGFTIGSTAYPASGAAIVIYGGRHDITIRNGFIRGGVTNNGNGVYTGPGFEDGIVTATGPTPRNVRVSGVSISGCERDGINLSSDGGALVENCVVRTVGRYGIWADTILACTAKDSGLHAIAGVVVSDSRGESVGGYGVNAVVAHNCTGSSVSNIGLMVANSQNCYGSSSSGDGLNATTAHNCYGSSSGSGTGLFAFYTAQNCYGESQSGPRGLYAVNASFCSASRPSGRAVEATLANGCWAAAGTNVITYKYNMP